MSWPYTVESGQSLSDNLAIITQRVGGASSLEARTNRQSFLRAIKQDVSSIVGQLNGVYKVLVQNLPQEDDIDVLNYGISGNAVFADLDATAGSSNVYWNTAMERGNTIKESLDVIVSELSILESAVFSISPPEVVSFLQYEDPGNGQAISPTADAECVITALAPGETRTLDAPVQLGQRLRLIGTTFWDLGTSATITAENFIDTRENSDILVDGPGELVELVGSAHLSDGPLAWRQISSSPGMLLPNGSPEDVALAAAADFQSNVWTAWKKPCRLATTTNITDLASGAPKPVDGFNPIAGNRILVWKQTDASENGIYRCVTAGSGVNGSWVRDTDFDVSADVISGLIVYVQQGTRNGQTRFTLITTGTITLDTTDLTFFQEAPLMRDDSSTTVGTAPSTVFDTNYVYTSVVDMTDFAHVSFWVVISDDAGGTVSSIDIICEGPPPDTVFEANEQVALKTDDGIVDGKFTPHAYVGIDFPITGESTVGPFNYPKKSGVMHFGVRANVAAGAYSVIYQRFAR